jgi:hypothetical protein
MDLKALAQKLEAFADGFMTAPYFRARVHFAEHIYDTLDEINDEVQRVLVGNKPGAEGAEVKPHPDRNGLPQNHRDEAKVIGPLRFRKKTLAEATRELLRDSGQLHGKEIEKLIKEGGYRSTAEHFQSSLAVALKRDGGFENVGENVWRVKVAPSTAQRSLEGPAGVLNGVKHEVI